MKQVEEEIQKIADELKKASTSTVVKSSTKKSKISQTKKKQPKQQQQQQQPQEEVADFDGNDEGEKNASEGIIATITGGIAVGLQTLLNHRAVVLFGVAALAIYTQGELASV